jgi:hypothetical protein
MDAHANSAYFRKERFEKNKKKREITLQKEDHMGRSRKGVRRYHPLLERNLVMAQKKELALRFELSEESWLAEVTVLQLNQLMDQYEQEHGIQRVSPGHLLVSFRRHRVHIPLLTQEWVKLSVKHHRCSEHRSRVQNEALRRFQEIDPSATLQEVYPYINRRALVPRSKEGGCKRMRIPESGRLIDPSQVHVSTIHPKMVGEVMVPACVQKKMLAFLMNEANIGRATALSMIQFMVARREAFCPRVSSLRPGQVVWLSLSANKHKPPGLQFARRVILPVVLTLFTEEEFLQPIRSLRELNRLHMDQVARILVEAFLQDTLLPLIELEMLFLRSHNVVEELIRNYMNIHQVILPTPGTVLDAGRAMTHKRMIVEKSVNGLFTSEIARETYHTPESVDAYLKVFQSVLILSLYGMPVPLMAQVTGRGQALIEEYLILVKEHFPNQNEMKHYLKEHGINIV